MHEYLRYRPKARRKAGKLVRLGRPFRPMIQPAKLLKIFAISDFKIEIN